VYNDELQIKFTLRADPMNFVKGLQSSRCMGNLNTWKEK
jgi:hypothetical protein